MNDITTEELLRLYRHTKSSLTLMEAMLMNRGVIRCPKCGDRHKADERHVFQPALMTAEVSG